MKKKLLIIFISSFFVNFTYGFWGKIIGDESKEFVSSILKKRSIKNADTIIISPMRGDTMNACVVEHASILSLGPWVELTDWVNNVIVKAKSGETIQELYETKRSPYKIALTLDGKEALRFAQAIIEHEAGHLSHEHLQTGTRAEIAITSTLSGGLLLLNFFLIHEFLKTWKEGNWLLLTDEYGCKYLLKGNWLLVEALKESWKGFLSLGVLLWCARAAYKGKFKSSLDKEREADAFISDDSDILKALARFFTLLALQRKYIDSYNSWNLRLHAWWNNMKPHEFYEAYPDWCDHTIFDPNKTHPTYNERINTLKMRIAELTGKNLDEINLSDTTILQLVVCDKSSDLIVENL